MALRFSLQLMAKRKPITAAELMAQINADPDAVARRKARDAERRRKEEAFATAEAPLLAELEAASVKASSVWDLVNSRNGYPQSLPILLRHLQLGYPDAIREGIARAMAIPDARFAWRELVQLYLREEGKQTKQGLAAALGNIADDELLDELIAIAEEQSLGPSRVLLLDALRRSRRSDIRKELERLSTDPILHSEAERILALIRKRTKRPSK